jgi:hypothetical protein
LTQAAFGVGRQRLGIAGLCAGIFQENQLLVEKESEDSGREFQCALQATCGQHWIQPQFDGATALIRKETLRGRFILGAVQDEEMAFFISTINPLQDEIGKDQLGEKSANK